MITTIALVVPPELYSSSTVKPGGDRGLCEIVLSYSRVIAAVLRIVYTTYLYFQLKTHLCILLNEPQSIALVLDHAYRPWKNQVLASEPFFLLNGTSGNRHQL